jgi:rhodanese-related sulfurtransferase
VHRSLLRVVVTVGVGIASGLLVNQVRGGLSLSQNAFLEEGDKEVEVKEARARLDHGALFLDARPRAFYEMTHIPGARSLPEDDFEPAFQRLEPLLRSRLDIVVYCSGFGCEASHDVAHRLKAKGIPAVVLQDGWPAWQEAGYPEKAGPDP